MSDQLQVIANKIADKEEDLTDEIVGDFWYGVFDTLTEYGELSTEEAFTKLEEPDEDIVSKLQEYLHTGVKEAIVKFHQDLASGQLKALKDTEYGSHKEAEKILVVGGGRNCGRMITKKLMNQMKQEKPKEV